ncbi:MAG: glycosyltransferase [Ideonella sp.]|nr:glycosyltransferase [Ideonella sp.]
MTPELTLIVPTYRRPDKLARALESVPGAIGHAHEVLVIDDCPDASGFEAARRHGARYVHKAGIDRGQSFSRNLGLLLARGRRIAFLDDDDFFLPGGLDRLLDASTDGRIVFGDYGAFNSEARTDISLAGVTMDVLLVCNQIPVGAFVLERSVLTRPFDVRMRSHEDWDFLLSNAGSGLRHVPGTVVMIDKTENLSTSTEARRRGHFWLDFLSIYARFPAPHLGEQRAEMMKKLGIGMPEGSMGFEDQI